MDFIQLNLFIVILFPHLFVLNLQELAKQGQSLRFLRTTPGLFPSDWMGHKQEICFFWRSIDLSYYNDLCYEALTLNQFFLFCYRYVEVF